MAGVYSLPLIIESMLIIESINSYDDFGSRDYFSNSVLKTTSHRMIEEILIECFVTQH